MIFDFLTNIVQTIQNGGISLPVLIGMILSIAFIAMLLVTIFTLLSIKKAELKAKKFINIPPSALKDKQEPIKNAPKFSMPLPIGETLSNYLIDKGYITTNNVVTAFFKAMKFLKSVLGTDYKYKLPWYLIIGEKESGKSSLLAGFTNNELLNENDENSPCNWWFLKNGVVLDIAGEIFLPSANGNNEDSSWQTILNLLVRYRGKKPLNGIILTIPVTEIYGKNKLSLEDLKQKANIIARKLSFAQDYVGLKLPVYIVITKTDIVPGFQSFCSEIPARNRSNMLGWSSPYSIDTIHTSKITETAFSDFEDELNNLRMEIFSENLSSSTRDGVFVFPSELLTIKNSLSCYIDTIFKSGSIETKFYFRGFYFTGDSKMVPLLEFDSKDCEAMAIMGTPDAGINEMGEISATFNENAIAPRKIFFFEDLLFRKIFVEDGIALAMKSKINKANNSIFFSKISTAAFVLIGSYGLFSASDKLLINKNTLFPSLFKLSSIIKNANDLTYKNLDDSGNEILAECTSQLSLMMQQINNARMSSAFVPASWFSQINFDLTETLKAAYQKIVVRAIYMNLVLKSKELLNFRPTEKSNSIYELLNPYNSKEYIQLKDYVFGLIELEKNIKKFDSLKLSADPKDLEDLVEYTFQGNLPKEFLDHYQDFRSILMNTPFPSINLSPYKKVAYDNLGALFQNYLDTIFISNSQNSISAFLTKFVDKLSRQKINEIPDINFVKTFSQDLTKVCKELGDEGKTWLDKENFESDKEYDDLLDQVEILFGKQTAQRLLDITAISFRQLKVKIFEFNQRLQNDLKKGGRINTKAPLSSGIFKMERCLADLISEPFMDEPGDYKLITDIPDGKMIFWDDELVQFAFETSKCYEKFMSTSIKDFPRGMQEGISLLAKSNLSSVIASIIAKSQSIVDAPAGMTEAITSEEILQKQVAELKGVAPKFVSLLRTIKDDSVSFVFANLRSVLNKIGFILLSHIDKLLENQKPYIPGNLTFSYWNGQQGAGLAAFSAADGSELNAYLELQRVLMKRLALDFAEVIVDFLNADSIYDQNYGNHNQLLKWTRIVDNVRGLQKKDPTNSISVMENFIKRTLNDYNLDNITSKISLKDLKGSSGNYFENIIKDIKKGIMSRAEILIRKRNIERYNSLRDYYQKHLENKYPFINYDKSQRNIQDADFDSVKEFFKMYMEFGGKAEIVLDQIYQLEGEAKELYEFMKKIDMLKEFFGDLINNQFQGLKLRLEMNFDINKKGETSSEYLVDRIFKPSADASIEPISENKSGIWYFGDPLEINFRWAAGDAQAPKPTYDQNDPDLISNENNAKFQCVGDWAALRFLQKYKTDDINADRLGANETVLCFKIPLNNGKISKIYVGVTASVPKKPGEPSAQTVPLPQTPEKMPAISNSIMSVLNEAVLTTRNQESGISSDEIEKSSKPINKNQNKMKVPEEVDLEENDDLKPDQSELKQNEKSLKSSEKKSRKDEVSKILNSKESENPDSNEEIIPVSEEPIE